MFYLPLFCVYVCCFEFVFISISFNSCIYVFSVFCSLFAGRRPKSCPTAAPCTGMSAPPPPMAPRGSFLPLGQSQEGLLPFQTERSSGSGKETASAQGGWRCGTAAPGAPCAMTPGAWQRPRWCVSSWAVARPWKPCGPRHSALEMGAFGWTMCSVGAGSPPCGTVLRSPGGRATASTRRMLV